MSWTKESRKHKQYIRDVAERIKDVKQGQAKKPVLAYQKNLEQQSFDIYQQVQNKRMAAANPFSNVKYTTEDAKREIWKQIQINAKEINKQLKIARQEESKLLEEQVDIFAEIVGERGTRGIRFGRYSHMGLDKMISILGQQQVLMASSKFTSQGRQGIRDRIRYGLNDLHGIKLTDSQLTTYINIMNDDDVRALLSESIGWGSDEILEWIDRDDKRQTFIDALNEIQSSAVLKNATHKELAEYISQRVTENKAMVDTDAYKAHAATKSQSMKQSKTTKGRGTRSRTKNRKRTKGKR